MNPEYEMNVAEDTFISETEGLKLESLDELQLAGAQIENINQLH